MREVALPSGVAGMAASATLRAVVLGTCVYLAVVPLVAVLRASLLLAAAAGLQALAGLAATVLLPLTPVDPIYGGAALHVLGGIQPDGLAIRGSVGEALHQAWPTLFVAPDAVPGGLLASAVLEPGATVVSRTLAQMAAALPLLTLGVALARWAAALGWLAFAGALLQAHVLLDQLLGSRLTLGELEATGLPFALAALWPVDETGQRALFTRHLDGLPETVFGLAWGLVACAVLYALARGLVRLAGKLRRVGTPVDRDPRPQSRRLDAWRSVAAVRANAARSGLLIALGLGLSISPLAAFAARGTVVAQTEAVQPARAAVDPVAEEPRQSTPPARPVPRPDADISEPRAAASRVPSVVKVQGRGYRYTYLVNGAPTVIRGVGYNPWYAKLSPDERARRYERDFSLMERVGVNTIEGWFQQQFDQLTLDAAQAHGLGVIMPFELNQDYDYSDPRIQAAFIDAVASWVLRYKDHPAVRMWGPGNELMHRLIYPTVVRGSPDPAREARADAFARFYVQLIDTIHGLDPNHPIVYRDAEDLYLSRLRDALARDGQRRQWFVYGTNAYTPRLQEVINRWPSEGLDAPLLVSEFAPGGVAPAERPAKLCWFWRVIRARPEMVLGGLLYTWTTDGPEDLDRVFGLTGPDGRPVDDSLQALSRLYHQD